MNSSGGTISTPADREGLDTKVRSQFRLALGRFLRHRVAMLSVVVLAAIIVAAFCAEFITPYSFDGLNLKAARLPPTLEGGHLFGTDKLGRDYFTRVLYGARTSIFVAPAAASAESTPPFDCMTQRRRRPRAASCSSRRRR